MKQLPPSTIQVIVPAGTYFLGDPCYAVPDDDWMALLDSCDCFSLNPIGTAPSGEKVLGFSTAYGDGEYKDNLGNKFGVDAGMIGLVPESYADKESAKGCGIWVVFTKDTLCQNDITHGVLRFGNHIIHTMLD